MKNYLVTNIENNEYTLKNIETNVSYIKKIWFYDLQKKVSVGDVITMHHELFDPNYLEYDRHYTFGALDKPYGRVIDSADHLDVICVKQQNKKTVLKRFFG